MTKNVQYLTEILRHIGTPLAIAVISDESDAQHHATNMASLLSRAVQLSIEIGNLIEIDKAETQDVEALRVSLAALAGPIVADIYKNSGRMPNESDVKKVVIGLEAVMTFSDNFIPSEAQSERIKNLKANGQPADPHQTHIQYIQAMSGVVDEIATFSFGQPEKKLVLEAGTRIMKEANTLAQNYASAADEPHQKALQLAFTQMLASLYMRCHKNAVEALSAIKEPSAEDQAKALDAVWQNFEQRANMVTVLAETMTPGRISAQPDTGQDQTPSVAPPQQAQPAAPVQQTQTEETPQGTFTAPKTEIPPAPPVKTQTEPPKNEAGYNPMSMFKSDDQSLAGSQAEPPNQPPPAEAAASPESAQPQQPPPVTPDDAQNTGEDNDSDGKTDGDQGDTGGSPMSFFKKGD